MELTEARCDNGAAKRTGAAGSVALAGVQGPAILVNGTESAAAGPVALSPPFVPFQPAGAWL